jgi:hypothetical protein
MKKTIYISMALAIGMNVAYANCSSARFADECYDDDKCSFTWTYSSENAFKAKGTPDMNRGTRVSCHNKKPGDWQYDKDNSKGGKFKAAFKPVGGWKK